MLFIYSSVYKDILKADATKRTAAKVSFGAVAEKIQKLLRAFAPKVLQDERDWRKYFTSVLEQELQWILDHAAGTTHHTAALVRTLDRWQHGLQDAAASQYMDVVQEKTPVLDHEAWDKVGALRKMTTDVVPEKMSASFLLDWAPEGINTSGQREHFVYAERMCKIINDQVSKQLAEAASEKDTSRGTGRTLGVWRIKLVQEVAEHIRVCHEKSRDFHGRKDVLMIMKSYLKSDYRRPLVLHGKPGCGKSAVLSKAAKEIHTWFNGCSPCILVRMIGCTTESTNIRTLIRSICVQLCHIFGDNPSQVPTDSKGIFNDFSCRLGQAREQKPLILLLDGTDRLSDEHEGRKLMWLPTELPPFVHIIISTVSDDKYDCLPCAHKLLNGHDKSFLEVPKLDEEDALKMLDHWLDQANRALTNEQHNILMQAFRKCPFPLFLKTVLTDALCWTSYTNRESLRLGESVRQVCTLRFGRLERDHGEAMVRRALGYITAARNGVTVNELEDVLSLDEAVMDEVVATHRPPRRRLPILLWIRLRMDIEGLITEIQTDGTRTLTWAHQPIRDAAEERYLLQRDKAPSYHKAFAEYFLGTWAGRPKPFTGSERGTNRLVASQELYYDPPAAQGSKPLGSHLIPSSHTAPSSQDHNGTSNNHRSTAQNPEHSSKNTPANTNRGSFSVSSTGTDEVPERIYNLRRVNELPFHLTRSQQTSLLKRNCLCNYEWMLAKLCGTSLRSVLEEYSAILTVEPHEPELRLISDVLHLSGQALRKEPRQLASQLVGRLHRIVSSDVPRASGDPQKYPNLHQLLASAKQSSLPALIPSIECLTEPGGILFDLLSGHSAPITAVALTSDGQRALTTSRDGTLKLWDVRSGKVVKSIDGVGKNTITVKAAKNNTLAVTVELPCIRLWSLKTGVCVHTIDDYPDPASICVAAEGQLLVAVFDGSNMLRSWTTDTGFQLLSEAQIANNSAHKEASLLIADASFGDSVLHAFRSGNTASVQNAKSGKLLKTLKCQDPSSSITALAISREYFVVCCRQQYMSLHELIALELFDAKKGTYVRSVRGCIHDRVSAQAFTTNLIGTHAIAISSNAKNNTSDVTLWNLETEDHKHLAQHPSISTMGACLDFRFCMTGSPSENSLRVWDISGKVNQPGVKLKKQLGVADIWPMVDNPRYVVAKAVNNGPISVWNVAKGKCLQSAVRIERGLTEGSDAIVMRNTTLVILTDRGFSSVSDDSRPVFQTVLVYDLRLKKYVRRLPGCYIVPAPSHEYVLLDNDSLLGPSDNRSHFIIWNLVTGHAASRIKTNFKELERRRMEQGGASGIPPGGVHLTDVPSRGKRATSAMMTPWDRRAETDSARRHRHEKESEKERQRQEELRREKDNVVEAFIVSADQTTIVASFYAHHLCVFDIASQVHTQTLQTENSMLFLHTAALSKDGSHLVLANYDESSKTSYVTLWDCVTGDVKRRLRNEANVAAVAITDDASRVLIGHSPDELHIWDPMRPNSLRRIRCKSEGRDRGGNNGVLNFEGISGNGSEAGNSFCRMFIVGGGERAIVFAGDVSVWDLDKGTMLAAFSPDTRVTACNVVLDGALTVFGMYDKPELVILRLSGAGAKFQTLDSGSSDDGGVELFGETTGDTSDEEDNSEEEGNEEAGSAE
ncbi:NACHT domain- and WD repeat-containing protein 1-like isoform x3 [Plakobranchus ocellatus]|uniref:NACHT domain- and WD repeat-containing protein 1-like isoform x3 n=1 Tax=Plakobranchus ocellatus TaxID=259542 RepID=A0AAV4DCB7_9GAST|nr:NACHT domain- and WD repeat-containing protein 1-like isoform x3 [Plakobranchus ocellatus]